MLNNSCGHYDLDRDTVVRVCIAVVQIEQEVHHCIIPHLVNMCGSLFPRCISLPWLVWVTKMTQSYLKKLVAFLHGNK